jgi:acetoin utilization protein AcuB
MRKIADIMTTEVFTLPSETKLIEAMVFMRERKVRHIPILDEGRLVGLVTDRDIKRATPSAILKGDRAAFEQAVRETPLARVMSRQLITTTEEASLVDTVQTFVEEKIGCMPVLDEGGNLQGIVTATDLLRAMIGVLKATDD